MDKYSLLREFADSWFLIAMFVFFLGTWVFAFLPSLRKDRDEASQIPFRNEARDTGCDKDCASCACNIDFLKEAENG